MNTFKSMASVTLLSLLASGAASADDSEWGVGVKAGTLGLGVEARWSGLPYVDFRIGANAYTLDYNSREAGIRYDGEMDLETFFATANFHFPLSPFRLTAGVFANGNELNVVGDETGTYNFGSDPTDWTQAEVGILSGNTSFGSTAPYVGLGFDFELFGKAGLNFDVGVLFQGEPDVTLASVGGTQSGNLRDLLDAEELQLEDDLSDYKAYPVISLSFVYNF